MNPILNPCQRPLETDLTVIEAIDNNLPKPPHSPYDPTELRIQSHQGTRRHLPKWAHDLCFKIGLDITKNYMLEFRANSDDSNVGYNFRVVKDDTLLHIFARAMATQKRKFYVLRFYEFLGLLRSHCLSEESKKLICAKNCLNEFFYQIKELSFLEQKRLHLIALDVISPEGYQSKQIFAQELRHYLLNEEFHTFSDKIKENLIDFILVSQVTETGNLLHWMTRKVWKNEKNNSLIRNNLEALVALLESKPSSNDSVNQTLLELLEERDSDGLTFKELNKKFETEHSSRATNPLEKPPYREAIICTMEGLLNIEFKENFPKHLTLCKSYLNYNFKNIKEFLHSLFEENLHPEMNFNVLLKFLSLEIVQHSAETVQSLKGDRLLHFLVRLKYYSGPSFSKRLENNIQFIEKVLHKYLSEKEKAFFLDAKNSEGLNYRQLESQLQQSDPSNFSKAFEPEEISSNLSSLSSREKFLPPIIMYNLCLSQALFSKYHLNDLLGTRVDPLKPNLRIGIKDIVAPWDTYLHILIRCLLYCESSHIKHHLLNLFLFAAKNYQKGGFQFLTAKNGYNQTFWEIDGLTPLDKNIFQLWLKKIKESNSDISELKEARHFYASFLNKFYNNSDFLSLSDELKNNLTKLLLQAKPFSNLYSGNTILHDIVTKIWENGTLNTSMHLNFTDLIEFLKDFHTTDPLEKEITENLLTERNRKGQTYVDLISEFVEASRQSSINLTDDQLGQVIQESIRNEKPQPRNQLVLPENDIFLITYYVEEARKLLENGISIKDLSLQKLIEDAVKLYQQKAQQNNPYLYLIIEIFRKRLTKNINKLFHSNP